MAGRTFTVKASLVEQLRKSKGLSIEELAYRTEVDVKTVARWLNGGPAFLKNLRQLATVLGASPVDLVGGPVLVPPPATTTLSPQSFDAGDSPRVIQAVFLIPQNQTDIDIDDVIAKIACVAAQAHLKGSINIVSLNVGSVVAFVEMESEDIVRIFQAFCSGSIDESVIAGIRFSGITLDIPASGGYEHGTINPHVWAVVLRRVKELKLLRAQDILPISENDIIDAIAIECLRPSEYKQKPIDSFLPTTLDDPAVLTEKRNHIEHELIDAGSDLSYDLLEEQLREPIWGKALAYRLINTVLAADDSRVDFKLHFDGTLEVYRRDENYPHDYSH